MYIDSVYGHTILDIKIVWLGVEDAVYAMTRVTLQEVIFVLMFVLREVCVVDKGVWTILLGEAESGK